MSSKSRYPERSLIQAGCRIYPGRPSMWWARRLALHPRGVSDLEYCRWLNQLVAAGVLVSLRAGGTRSDRTALYAPDSPEYWAALASPRSEE